MPGECQAEKEEAARAQQFVRTRLEKAKQIQLKDAERGKYFRIVARVIADGLDLSKALLYHGHAVKYGGKTKKHNWCSEEKAPSKSKYPQQKDM